MTTRNLSNMSNEMIRSMSNISDKISQDEKTKVVDNITQELKNSGNSRKSSVDFWDLRGRE